MTDVSYEAWRSYIFDRDTSGGGMAWYWNVIEDPLRTTPQQAALYTARLFSNAGSALAEFSHAQVALGLDFMMSSTISSHVDFFKHESVTLADRIACIEAMTPLFRDVMAVRCEPGLSHRNEAGRKPLNRVCYMWWDVIPLYGRVGGRKGKPIQDACLSVMRDTLGLPNQACQESALHGLGHWAGAHPEFTAATIDDYLAANPRLRPELVRYAQAARAGRVQ